jgi:hypothetical protein
MCDYTAIPNSLSLFFFHLHPLVCFVSFVLSFGINCFVPVSRVLQEQTGSLHPFTVPNASKLQFFHP